MPQVNTRLPQGMASWFVLAAWDCPERTWCGLEFGLNTHDPKPFTFYECMPCFSTSGVETPTASWPRPNEGTACVATGDPGHGNWPPVYWFGGYAYDASHGSTVIQIGIYPPSGLCGLTNCEDTPSTWAVDVGARGGMDVNEPGDRLAIWPPVPLRERAAFTSRSTA